MALDSDAIRQAAAIPIKSNQLCLVTSRSGKRWVIPKGCIEPGKTAGEIALQEAWEEAGLTGLLQREPIGSYVYEKFGLPHHVIVFMMRVTEVADAFPEKGLRERVWLAPAQAIRRVDDNGLRELLRAALVGRSTGTTSKNNT
jgi:8-oxo-dGTP pyrophosphatase MutT (NUDIX family)